MSPPLTVAWKDPSFHVCGGEDMSCGEVRTGLWWWGGGVVGGPYPSF